MDREDMATLFLSVKEIAATVKRMEERLELMGSGPAQSEPDLKAFRSETREQLSQIARRLAHHDRMLMDHDRRIQEQEETAD